VPRACGASEQIGVGAVKRMRKRITFCLAIVLALSLLGTSARCADIRSFTTETASRRSAYSTLRAAFFRSTMRLQWTGHVVCQPLTMASK
jgi:hypothetical protein